METIETRQLLRRIRYGDEPPQFGDLRLPPGEGPFPAVVFLHGGCWRARYDLEHVAAAVAALTGRGIATWNLEYRRVGDDGGGWPGTFEDVARGTDHLRRLAAELPLDLDRVVLMGHSAGGHLALWLAGRRNLPPESALHRPDPLAVRGVVSLAGITDLTAYGAGTGTCNQAVSELLGGSCEKVPERYFEGSPSELLPLGVPTRLVHGAEDPIVPLEESRGFEAAARARGDDSRLRPIAGAGHFEVIDPAAAAWAAVERAAREVL